MSGNITRNPTHEPGKTVGGTVCGSFGKLRAQDGETTCLRCLAILRGQYGRGVSRRFNFPHGKAARAPRVVQP